jgi:hypothetical protein
MPRRRLDDQSALYNVVYCFEFLDQNLDAIAYLNKYIDKTVQRNCLAPSGTLVLWVKDYENAIRAFDYATDR